MRSLLALSLLIAAPAAAQSTLPAPVFRATYVEASCGGGIADMSETVRLAADGRVLRSGGRPPIVLKGQAAPARFADLSRRLDRADFDRRTTPRATVRIADGIDCSLTRVRNGVPHTVELSQGVRGLPQVRDLAQITDEVMTLGRNATTPKLRPAGR